MKNARPSNLESSASNSAKFTGTDNPPHLRALAVLLRHPIAREQLDGVAGCSKSPELVAELRGRGLGDENLPCDRVRFIDRDGCMCCPGVYSLTSKGRRMVYAWLAKRDKGMLNG